jgi:hypothetical protein
MRFEVFVEITMSFVVFRDARLCGLVAQCPRDYGTSDNIHMKWIK